MAKNLLLVDGTNIAYRWISKPSNMHDYYPRTVISLARSFDCEHILVSIDNKSSSYRKEIYPEYKGNRRKNKTPEEMEEIKHFYDLVHQLGEVLAAHDIPVISLQHIETDDIIAYVVKHYHNVLDNIWIISSDKDLYQLFVYPNVHIYALTAKTEMHPDTFMAKYEISPEQWVDLKAMMGDTSDNIPGINGIGEKRGIQYLQKYGPHYEDILENLPKMKKKLGKIDQRVLDGAEIVKTNKRLMDLLTYCDDIISDDYKEIINEFMAMEGVINES